VVTALVLALAAVFVLLLVPSYHSESIRVIGSNPNITERTSSHSHLIGVNGLGALLALSVPVMLCTLATGAQWTQRARLARISVTVLLWVWVVIGLFSIGFLYLPSAGAMTVAAVHRDPGVFSPG
jgi:hypothetical protein